MARHFSLNKQSSGLRSWQDFSNLDWLHFFGRFLVCLYFLHDVLWNLSELDTVTAQVAAATGGFIPAELVLPYILVCIALAFIGSALFFTASDPHSFYLLGSVIVTQVVVEHVVPMTDAKISSAAFQAHLGSVLTGLAMLGALTVIHTYTEQIEWLEGERKAEIRRALEEWYDKQQSKPQGAGGGKAAAEVEEKKEEPKKVK